MTLYTIDDDQLRAMRKHARREFEPGWHDDELVELCEAALAGDHRARAECARILAETEPTP
jgi:hypothetical protein